MIGDEVLGIVDQERALAAETQIEDDLEEVRPHVVTAEAIGQAVLEGADVVDLPLAIPPRGQQSGLAHDDQVAAGREVGRQVGFVHHAVDGMQELGMELVGSGRLDLRPLDFAILDQPQVAIDGQVGKGRRGQAIEELLDVRPRDVAQPRPLADNQVQGHRLVLVSPPGERFQVLDEPHPIGRRRVHPQPLDGKTLQEHVDQAGQVHEVLQRQGLRAGANLRQEGPQVRRQAAVIAESGRVAAHGDRVLLRAVWRLVPVRHQANDLAADLRFGHCQQQVGIRHGCTPGIPAFPEVEFYGLSDGCNSSNRNVQRLQANVVEADCTASSEAATVTAGILADFTSARQRIDAPPGTLMPA